MTQDQPSYFDLELLASQLRKHSDDLSLYAGFLLNVLSAALPGEIVTVKREGKIKAGWAVVANRRSWPSRFTSVTGAITSSAPSTAARSAR